mgnify:CR=1 FL=1
MNIKNIDAFVFDFDGVLTDNFVHVDQNGKEIVSCSRADGLGFDVLHSLNMPTYILSTEKNPVVSARAKKLMVNVIQGTNDKSEDLKKLAHNNGYRLDNIFYVGNDLNDFQAIKLCGFSACPADSHFRVKEIVDIVLKLNGGKGIVREILEDCFELDFIKFLNN